MCGIFGVFGTNPESGADLDVLGRMNRVLTHRGPDGEGLHADGPLAIGMRRLSIIDLKTGDAVWTERLKGASPTGQNWSSVMLADGNCYTITQGGDCYVFKAQPTFELVGVNSLGERSNSSIVPSNGELFIRTHAALWCIRSQP